MLGNLRIRAVAAAAALCGLLLTWADVPGARESPQPVTPLISSGKTIVGETLVYPTSAPAKVTAVVVPLAPGQETGWHTHGVPVFGYVLEGELEVDYGDKGIHVYHAGDALLEAIAAPHNGRNIGTGPVRILAVFMGAEGLKTTEPVSR